MLDKLQPIDTLVADCFYCTYWLVAACQHKRVHIVMKNYDKRPEDPLGATRIDRRQRTTVWLKPQRLDWVIPQEHTNSLNSWRFVSWILLSTSRGFAAKSTPSPRLCLMRKFTHIASCKNNLVEPWAYLHDVLNRLAHKPATEKRIQLLPDQWLTTTPNHR